MALSFLSNSVPLDAIYQDYASIGYWEDPSASKLWAWGYNVDGNLGLGDRTDRSSPVQVGSLSDWSKISVRYTNAGAIKTDGTLWTWGSNSFGELGLNDITPRSSPVQVGSLTNWKSVSCEQNGSCMAAIKTDGTLWTWGYNGSGRLGLGDITTRSSPVQVGSLTNWKSVVTNQQGMTALKNDGTMWAWGNTTLATTSSPVQVGTNKTWSTVHSGGPTNHFMALATDGTLWGIGSNVYGQIGINDTSHQYTWIQIGTLTSWKNVKCGSYQTYAIKTDGTLWSWGYNDYYNLGHGNTTRRSSPVQVGTLTNWNSIAPGMTSWGHVLLTKTDGTLWTWGYNYANGSTYGALGLGDTSSRISPTQIGSLTNWKYATTSANWCSVALQYAP